MRLLLPLPLLLILAALTPAAHAAELVGAVHEHSGYSDGHVGSRPADYYAAGRAAGLDFVAGTEHAEILGFPGTLGEGCLSAEILGCLLADTVEPANALRKWAAAGEQAAAATDGSFTGLRGFEWTSDRSGHLGVLFSTHTTSAYVDGGNLDVDAFWRWFTRPVAEGGGADALGIFNHPGDKGLGEADPAFNWEHFRHVPAADGRMVGLEVFNGGGDHLGSYHQALDKGWHVGAVGAEDAHDDGWAEPGRPKTVLLAGGRAPDAIRAALEGRRMYALRSAGAPRLTFAVDDALMGSRLRRAAGDALSISAHAPGATVELVSAGGEVVATGAGAIDVTRAATGDEPWYYVRAKDDDRVVSVSSPVWVTATDAPRAWLAGDLHVHSCASHDVLCVPDTETSEPWTLGIPVRGRFAEASLRGLDFLAITDHNDTSSAQDPGFGSSGVLGLPGYENSLDGHMQVLGVDTVLDNGDKSPAAIRRLVEAVHARGGAVQANHPGDGEGEPFGGCDAVGTDAAHLDWKYGYDVPVDTVEVLNPTSPAQTAEAFLDCRLDRGERVGVTGGSDSHWALLAPLQGAGNPTTWVHADAPTAAGLAAAIREGRTSVSKLPPALGGAPATIEDEQGRVVIGEAVAPGTPLRVRAPSGGLVTVKGAGVQDVRVAPGGTVPFTAPETGWARAVVTAAPERPCAPNGLPVSTCPYDASILALTSPVYVEAPETAAGTALGRLRVHRGRRTPRRIRLGRRASGTLVLARPRGARVQLLVDGRVVRSART